MLEFYGSHIDIASSQKPFNGWLDLYVVLVITRLLVFELFLGQFCVPVYQELLMRPLEEIVVPIPNTTALCAPKMNGNISACNSNGGVERKPRPRKEQALNCPRCNSTNTKFCYYNNYSLTQPRYFCKSCRRYWTEGGSPSASSPSEAAPARTRAAPRHPPPPRLPQLSHLRPQSLIDPLLNPHHHVISAPKLGVSSSAPSTVAT
ncbi:hypothetical protein SAY87_012371 [Trapa incisa]|uniref:Dof zinc finger protein n=1 Tax=Trapa incisa TaxID=236973 RepID=A0AAN7GQ64_9MYRT|nr:hypothetical protein SAY87_012371 [Trapa incisa]